MSLVMQVAQLAPVAFVEPLETLEIARMMCR